MTVIDGGLSAITTAAHAPDVVTGAPDYLDRYPRVVFH
jgi:hypothetical protein